MHWTFEPGAVAALLGLAMAYALGATRLRPWLLKLGGPPPKWHPPGSMSRERYGALHPLQVITFYGGVLVAAFALLSPLHDLGERYLLSAHMVQHLLMTQVVAPLLLLGIPGWMLRPLFKREPFRSLGRQVLIPIPAFVAFNLIFSAWHVPLIYDLSLNFAPLHAIEHGLFLTLALAAWWPVLGPLPELPRLPHGGQVLYLFFQSLPPTVLGAMIALSDLPIYPTYWAQTVRLAFLGFPALSPLEDQQLGGLIMWIPGALGYFLVLSVVFFQWLERRSPIESPPYGTLNPDRPRAPLSGR